MNKKMIAGVFLTAAMASMVLTGCSNAETAAVSASSESAEASTSGTEDVSAAEASTQEDAAEDAADVQTADISYVDLGEYVFEYSSGRGGWGTEFTVEADGSFNGNYHAFETEETGDDYEEGTQYQCGFSGHFSELKQTGDYTYEFSIEDFAYTDPIGTETIADGIRYIDEKPYGFPESGTFCLYMPGAAISDIDQEIFNDYIDINDTENAATLQKPAIVCASEKSGYHVYSRTSD